MEIRIQPQLRGVDSTKDKDYWDVLLNKEQNTSASLELTASDSFDKRLGLLKFKK